MKDQLMVNYSELSSCNSLLMQSVDKLEQACEKSCDLYYLCMNDRDTTTNAEAYRGIASDELIVFFASLISHIGKLYDLSMSSSKYMQNVVDEIEDKDRKIAERFASMVTINNGDQ